jgi:hypothetical protein
MSGQQSHAHHYGPPDTVLRDGISYRRNDRLYWGPARCFYKDDLYTLRFAPATTDVMEQFFFGMVDRLGMSAGTEMAEFAGIRSLSVPDAFRNLPSYMGAQRFRTPKGLDEIKKLSSWEDLTPFAQVYASTQRFRLRPEFYRCGRCGPNLLSTIRIKSSPFLWVYSKPTVRCGWRVCGRLFMRRRARRNSSSAITPSPFIASQCSRATGFIPMIAV